MEEARQYSKKMKEENHEEGEEYYFNDSDMAAAHQLMQLSDEDDQNINNNKNIMINKEETADDNSEEVDQICCRITTTSTSRRRPDWVIKVINEEIFGKDVDDEEVCDDIDDRPQLPHLKINKKRRYRSLASIYGETKPIDCDDDDRHCRDEALIRKKP